MKITNEILHAVIYCNHKVFLKKVQENQFPQTEFQAVFKTLKQKQESAIQTKLSIDLNFQNIDYLPNLKLDKGKTYFQVSFKNAEIDLRLDGFYFDQNNSCIPIIISPFEKVQKIRQTIYCVTILLPETSFQPKNWRSQNNVWQSTKKHKNNIEQPLKRCKENHFGN